MFGYLQWFQSSTFNYLIVKIAAEPVGEFNPIAKALAESCSLAADVIQ